METYSTPEVCRMIGASYRQVHYCVMAGYVPGLHAAGQGYHLRWTPDHIAAARDVKARLDAIRVLQPRPSHELPEEGAVSA